MLFQAINEDIFYKHCARPTFMKPGKDKDAALAEIGEKHWPAAMATLAKHLPSDGKFINGDKLTTHDFTVGGLLLNVLDNPNVKDPKFWA